MCREKPTAWWTAINPKYYRFDSLRPFTLFFGCFSRQQKAAKGSKWEKIVNHGIACPFFRLNLAYSETVRGKKDKDHGHDNP
jgi:hypothetical protein